MSETLTTPIIHLPHGKKIKIIKVGPTTKPVLTAKTAKILLPMPNLSTRVIKQLPPLKFVKNMDDINHLPEMALKGQLIKDFSDCGVNFNNSMLAVINKFFTGVKSLFTDKISILEAAKKDLLFELVTLRKTCKDQREVLQNSRKNFIEAAQASEHEYILEAMKRIKNLNTRFMKEIEATLTGTGSHIKIKNGNEKSAQGEVDAVEKLEKFENIVNLINDLATRLPGTNVEELVMCKPQLEKIWLFLLSREELLPTIPTTNIDAAIEQLPINEKGKETENQLCSDVNMGYELSVPTVVQPQRQKRVLLHEFLPYLINCTNAINSDGDRPIHINVLENNFQEVKKQCIVLKLQRKCVDIFNDNDYTPLHLAVLHNVSMDIIKHLLSFGASYDLRDGDGNSLLHLATESCSLGKLLDESVLEIIGGLKTWQDIIDIHNHDGYTALHLAAMQNKHDELQKLISLQAHVDEPDTKSGRTALYYAVENNDVIAVNILLEYNANPHVQTYGGGSIVQALSELDSDFTPAMKKLFYKDLMTIKATKEQFEGKSSKRNRPNNCFTDRRTKRNKPNIG